MKKTILINLVTLLLLLSCTTSKLTTEITIQKLGDPPGTKIIADNLYYDERNIDNISYLEFLYWMNSKYGKNSNEYKSVLPDSNQWRKLNINYASLDSSYFRHPKFKNFPVLGVSAKQARQYSKWRSDRVMEYTLIKYGIIKMKPNAPKDSVFTIEKYFAGQYYNVKPSPYLLYYPEYLLLDSTANTTAGFRNICTYKKWK